MSTQSSRELIETGYMLDLRILKAGGQKRQRPRGGLEQSQGFFWTADLDGCATAAGKTGAIPAAL